MDTIKLGKKQFTEPFGLEARELELDREMMRKYREEQRRIVAERKRLARNSRSQP